MGFHLGRISYTDRLVIQYVLLKIQVVHEFRSALI